MTIPYCGFDPECERCCDPETGCSLHGAARMVELRTLKPGQRFARTNDDGTIGQTGELLSLTTSRARVRYDGVVRKSFTARKRGAREFDVLNKPIDISPLTLVVPEVS